MVDTKIPSWIIAGDTVRFDLSYGDYIAADGYGLTLAIVSQSTGINATGVDSGDGVFSFSISAADSAKLAVGENGFQLYATKTGERETIDSGTITVKPNFAISSAGVDARSQAQTIVENIDAMFASNATLDQQSYSIAGRSLSRHSPTELIALRDKYNSIYQREKRAARLKLGKGSNSKIRVRF